MKYTRDGNNTFSEKKELYWKHFFSHLVFNGVAYNSKYEKKQISKD